MYDLRYGAMLVLATLAGCGGSPVAATNCMYQQMSDGTKIMRATLTNTSAKTIERVGVLPGDEPYEFEFYGRILPNQSENIIIGTPYAQPTPHPRSKVKGLRPVMGTCWARLAEFADGSNWSTSPL